MALEIYMLGLIVQDMPRSLEFYRRLGLAIPAGHEDHTHVEVKMQNGLTLFLDSNPARWDPAFVKLDSRNVAGQNDNSTILEFYLQDQQTVAAKYHELTSLGYQSYRAPYKTSFGMYFAMVKDPDGNTVLLSGDLTENTTAQEG